MFFFVEVKSAGKEFDFVPEEIEGDTAREISEVLELHFAEGNRLFRTIENDAAGVGRGFVEEGDEDIADAKGRLIDGDRGVTGGICMEPNFPAAFTFSDGLVAREKEAVNDHGQNECGDQMARESIGRFHDGARVPQRCGRDNGMRVRKLTCLKCLP